MLVRVTYLLGFISLSANASRGHLCSTEKCDPVTWCRVKDGPTPTDARGYEIGHRGPVVLDAVQEPEL